MKGHSYMKPVKRYRLCTKFCKQFAMTDKIKNTFNFLFIIKSASECLIKKFDQIGCFQ